MKHITVIRCVYCGTAVQANAPAHPCPGPTKTRKDP